jgi:F420-dependent oxidoreductase-like protein
MQFALMIEGQEGVSWQDWLDLARVCEDSGFGALMRSDHYHSVDAQGGRGALDAWATVCALATVTSRVRLGTLVSPATFRHPSVLAKMATTADHISGGRIDVGMGTGWLEAEHRLYGFPYPPLAERMSLLEEQVEIVRGHWGDGPFSFSGEHYLLEEAYVLPKPVQRPGPPLLLGGAAGPRSARLAARFADEYNSTNTTPEQFGRATEALRAACARAGRDPGTLRRSLMTPIVIGRDEGEVLQRGRDIARRRGDTEGAESPERYLAANEDWLVGTPDRVIARLREYEAAGAQRVMLQHWLHTDHEAVRLIASTVIPELTPSSAG